MGKQCRDVLDVIPETVVLAFDVAGWSSPADANRIATSKQVVDAISKALAARGRQLIKKHASGETITQDDALDMLASAGKPFLDNRKRELKQRIECAYKESPLGLWLDKNEWVLYVVLPLVVGGAGTYMYVARVGDTPAKWATSFANVKKSWPITHLGRIEVGTTGVEFVPTKREIAAKVFGKLDWERLSVKVTLGGGMTDGEVSGASVSALVTAAVTHETKITAGTSLEGLGKEFSGKSTLGATYKGTGAGADLMLNLGGTIAYDRSGVTSVGGKAGAGVTGDVLDMPTTLGFESGYKHNFGSPGTAHEVNFMLKLSVDF